MLHNDLKLACRGKWHSLLPILGVDSKYLTGKHGPCPICSDGGVDRFRFSNKDGDGLYYCSQCDPNAGDGFSLAINATGRDFKSIAEEIRRHVGQVEHTQGPKEITSKEAIEQRNALWRASVPIERGDLVSEYLANRGLGAWVPNADFRTLHDLIILNEKRIGSPGMIAMVRGPDGKPVTLHQTPIKNGIRDGKRYLSRGSYPDGSAIRLAPAAEIMAVAEGVESAQSASIISGLPVWALINAQNFEKFVAPEICKKLIVFGDFDKSYTGQAVASCLARKTINRGIECEVQFAEYGRFDFDWNDKIIETQKGAM